MGVLAVLKDGQRVRFSAERYATANLEAANIKYVVFKGSHLGEALYEDPLLRPRNDVDILVHEHDRDRSLQVLAAAGFAGRSRRSTASHQVSVWWQGGEIDLHWSVHRPGRVRFPLEEWVLSGRQPINGRWVPDGDATTVLLLANPALADYVTGRAIRAVDLDRWMARFPPRWDIVVDVLSQAGLRTAAWATLLWTHQLLGSEVPADVSHELRPGFVRRTYLAGRVRADPRALYDRHPLLARAGFSGLLADNTRDALRASIYLARSHLRSRREAAHIDLLLGQARSEGVR